MNSKKISFAFISLALFCLIAGLCFGATGTFQYINPSFLKQELSFQQIRPLHVFLVTQFIWCAASGGLYYYLTVINNKLYSNVLGGIHFFLQLFCILAAVIDFFGNRFSGREYLEFPLSLSFMMIAGWVCCLVNFIGTIRSRPERYSISTWSWLTGILFFIITLTESSLWSLHHFNDNIVRDVTIQWKALGSMVGAWNMLIYGSAIRTFDRKIMDISFG